MWQYVYSKMGQKFWTASIKAEAVPIAVQIFLKGQIRDGRKEELTDLCRIENS